MVWGTDEVYHHTLERCSQQGIAPYTLPELNDIDTVEDLRRFHRHAPKSKFNTQTYQYLAANEIVKDA